jgi:hypothetical protein
MASAIVEGFGYVAAFVGAVYAFPSTRTMDHDTRDSPGVVKRRCFAIMAVSVACAAYHAQRYQMATVDVLVRMLAGSSNGASLTPWAFSSLPAMVTAVARASVAGLRVTATLFAGVIVNQFLNRVRSIVADAIDELNEQYRQRRESERTHGRESGAVAMPSPVAWGTALVGACGKFVVQTISAPFTASEQQFWVCTRNYAIAPLAEEITLRYMPIAALERAVIAATFAGGEMTNLTRDKFAVLSDCILVGGSAPLFGVMRLTSSATTTTSPLGLSLVHSLTARMWWSAAFFAASHLHHGLRYYRSASRYVSACDAYEGRSVAASSVRRRALVSAAQQVVVDTLVTGAFGLLSSWILLRRADGAIVAPLASHVFCNLVGAPSLAYLFEDRHTLEPGSPRGGKLVPKWVVSSERVAISAAHALGIYFFAREVLRD